VLFALTLIDASAADATFSKEKQNGYLRQRDSAELTVVDIQKLSVSELGGTGWGIIVRLRKPENGVEGLATRQLSEDQVLDEEIEKELAQRLNLYGKETANSR